MVGLRRLLPTWTWVMVRRRALRPSLATQRGFQVPTGSPGTLRAVSGPGDYHWQCWVCGGEAGRLSVLCSVMASQKGHTFHPEPSNSQTCRLHPSSLLTSLGDPDKMDHPSLLGILHSGVRGTTFNLLNKVLNITFHYLECLTGFLLSLGVSSQILNKTWKSSAG